MSEHWYERTSGRPAPPSVTLKLARKDYKYVPSVTTVLHSFGTSPFLIPWAAKLAAEAAWDLRPTAAEVRESWLAKVKREARARREAGGVLGTEVHAMLEARLKGETYTGETPLLRLLTGGALAWLSEQGAKPLCVEHTFASSAYGGKVDLLCELAGKRVLVDFKTGAGKAPYEHYYEQLEAYNAGGRFEASSLLLLMINRETGAVSPFRWPPGGKWLARWQAKFRCYQVCNAWWPRGEGVFCA